MKTILIISLIMCPIVIMYLIWILYRNEKVGALQFTLVKLSYRVLENYLQSLKDDSELDIVYYNELRKQCDDICSISHNRMLYSFRPLTIGEWLTKEQIDFLKLKF